MDVCIWQLDHICLCACVCMPIRQSACMSVCSYVCTPVCLHVCTSARLCICTSVRLHICASACLCICASVRLCVCVSVHQVALSCGLRGCGGLHEISKVAFSRSFTVAMCLRWGLNFKGKNGVLGPSNPIFPPLRAQPWWARSGCENGAFLL